MCIRKKKVEEYWKLSGFELMIAEEIFRGTLPEFPSRSRSDCAESGDAVYGVDMHSSNHVFKKGPQDDGAGAEHVVSAVRPESAKNLCRIFLKRRMRITRRRPQTIYRSEKYASSVAVDVLP